MTSLAAPSGGVGRGTLPGLATPHRLVDALPALFQQVELDARTGTVVPSFTQRFTEALDELLAPVFSSLDNIAAYFDPELTPPDFLDWLAGWVGLVLDETWPLARRRALLGRAVGLYGKRGTARGLAEHVAVYTGFMPEIVESGGVSWSTTAESELPGEARPRLVLRLVVDDPDEMDIRRVRALVAAARPAHVPVEIEVVKP